MQPIDSAWNLLKAYGTADNPLPSLSREDLEQASRTGGMARMPGTMRPSSMAEQMPQRMGEPILDDFGKVIVNPKQTGAQGEAQGMMQEYNELIHPEEEAEHRRINAPTPVSMPGTIDPNRHILEQRLQDMRYPMAQMREAGHTPETNLPMRQMTQDHMKLQHRLGQRPAPQFGAPMPVGEVGDASMDDPSQMEHLGRELADAHHEDIDPSIAFRTHSGEQAMRRLFAGEPNSDQDIFNLESGMSRAPNRHAYMQRR